MKKFLRPFAAIVMSAAMCLSLCACDMDLGTMLLMKKVYDAAEDTESFEAEATADMELVYDGEAAELSMEADCRATLEPLVMEINCAADTGILGRTEAPVYIVGGDDALELYLGLPVLGETVWLHESVELPDGETEDLLSLVGKGSELNVEVGKEQTVNGEKAVELTLTLPAEIIEAALDAGDGELDDMPVTVWVSKKTGRILRAEADLAQLVRYALEASELSAALEELKLDIELKSMPTVINVTGYNSVESITLPDTTDADSAAA